MAKIFLSVPVLGRPELKMMYTMYQAILSSKHEVRVYYNENDSLISRVRNVHISAFYNKYPDCDYFVSLDSDIQLINCVNGNNIFDKLVSHNVDFCGGLYAVKKPGPKRCSSICASGVVPPYNSGLCEMTWLSSGCWCINRSVVAKMVEAYPELHYDGDDNAVGEKLYGLYIPMLYDLRENDFAPDQDVKLPFRKYLSEDWSFCQRWRQLGGKMYADTSILLQHIGKINYVVFDPEEVHKSIEANPPPAGHDLKE